MQLYSLFLLLALCITSCYCGCTWVNVCPTSMSGKNVHTKIRVFSPGAVSSEIIRLSLQSCSMYGTCGVDKGLTYANCDVKKEWKSTNWSGHYQVCYKPGKAKFQCFSSQWKSKDQYKC
ncbi:hypothetical protein BY458DRAFT_518722 [Sporodiniella umbellata]|nr:hypothetical protein BY458DRAFT_518722 [Sporodiniella umbellata]